MERHRSGNPQREEARTRISNRNKQNPVSDTVYLIQNQNDVLRMKNAQLTAKIKELKLQLQLYTDNIVLQQADIDNMRTKISSTGYKDDIEIENQKKLLTQKLTLLKSEEEILLRKIKEAREATVFEEQKVAKIQNDRKNIDIEILSLKAQNEGTKIVLRNLEQENERLREENQRLISKRKVHEPKEKELSIQIEGRIRIIKSQQQSLKSLKKHQIAKLLDSILSLLYNKKLGQYFSKVTRYSLLRKLAHKKLFQMALMRRKYTLFIKHQILQRLRTSFRPLNEQQKTRRIISATHKRRVKANIWRIWRKQLKNAELATTQKFQFQNTIVKISESFSKTNLFACFNALKYYKNNPFHQRAVLSINQIWTNFMNRSKTHFFSALRAAWKRDELQQQIQASSKEQSELLVISLYFTAWGKLAKSHAIQNKNIKRRYFRELKKLLTLKKRRKLGEMLTETNEKLTIIDIQSKVFTTMTRQGVMSKLQSLDQQRESYEQKKVDISQKLGELHCEKKYLYQELSLLKISKYLQKKVQKAFNIWRLRKQQAKVILTIMNLIESKKAFDKNFGFAQILKKRFAMLKKSINDKIQSCEFSYNYLLDQNKHIKQVLDNKTHELEKTKFMNILKKICRNQKEMKSKYFFKFMRSGFKFWQFRKTCQRIDQMAEKKIKVVFMWLLKEDLRTIKEENRVESFLQHKESIIIKSYLKRSMKGFETNRDRCKRLKRVMGGIFQRNLELDFYTMFGRIRNEEHIYYRSLIQADIDQLQGQINKVENTTLQQNNKIETLKNRLEDKQQTFAQRKILGLYQFFVKNIKSRFGRYLQRWRTRAKRQNNVLQFARILERKSRVALKNKFMSSVNRKHDDEVLNELQEKHKRFQNQYDKMATNQEKFLRQNQEASLRMKQENEVFKQEGAIFEKKTEFMTNLKLKSFRYAWGKKMLGFCFREWRTQTDIFIQQWSYIEKVLNTRVLNQTWAHLAKQMKEEVFKHKIRTNLEKIYTKKYRYNLGLGFRTWKYVNLYNRIKMWTEQQKKQMKRFQGLEKKYKYAVGLHDSQITFRQYDPTLRGLWNQWRQYTQKKIFNNIKKQKLQTWLFRGYGSQFLRLLKKKVNKKIEFKEKLNNFKNKWQELRIRAFMEYTSQNKHRRNSVIRLFINKFSPFMIQKALQESFSMINNYGNNQQITKKTDLTDRIQKVIQTFEKKRKSILNFYVRRWRRNQYQMRIAKNLMKRITKNAMNWRVKDLFYTWKLETEAKRVKQMHEEEGQVKKRKIQINRLKIFLEDFKKQKGLLLEDEAGKFVLSPRFQQKKDQQIKKDNNLRYRFISRLILSMNGYSAPARAWNNFRMYMLLRQKIRKAAKFVKNNLRKPELYYAFRIWHKASKQFNNLFDTMERKGLIKILNKQKDKMEMEYSKKVNLQQKIQEEMKYHQILSYHQDRKQKLSVHLLLKNVRKIKLYSLLAWKDRVRELKQTQLQQLEEQGNSKIAHLEDQVSELEETERELRQNNMKLQQAVREALEIAEMVKRITEERDLLSKIIQQKQLTCESLQEENQQLNAKLYQAQKQAMNLLILSGQKL